MLRLLSHKKREKRIVEIDDVEYYKVIEFAKLMRRHKSTIYSWLREDKIPHVGSLIPKRRVDILRKVASYLCEDITTVYGWIKGQFIEDDEIEDYIWKRIIKNKKRSG